MQEKLVDTLEGKENLTVDSEELLNMLNTSNRDRILIENSLNEHRIQRDILCTRTGAELYRETSNRLIKFYILLRDSNIQLKIAIQWFMQIITKNFARRIQTNTNSSLDHFDMIHKVQARETYLRCFQSIYSYLSLSLSNEHLQYLLVLFAFVEENNQENLVLFQFILKKLNPINREIIPTFLDDQRRPKFVNSHSWLLCLTDEINEKYFQLSEHLIEHQSQWKEYLFSSIKFDFINKSPIEQTRTLTVTDRFLLSIILQPDKVCFEYLLKKK